MITSALLMLALAPSVVGADEPEFRGSSASHGQTLSCLTKAKKFDPFTLGWLVNDGLYAQRAEIKVKAVQHPIGRHHPPEEA